MTAAEGILPANRASLLAVEVATEGEYERIVRHEETASLELLSLLQLLPRFFFFSLFPLPAVGVPAILLAASRLYQKNRFLDDEIARLAQHNKELVTAMATVQAAGAASAGEVASVEAEIKRREDAFAALKREVEQEKGNKELAASQVS